MFPVIQILGRLYCHEAISLASLLGHDLRVLLDRGVWQISLPPSLAHIMSTINIHCNGCDTDFSVDTEVEDITDLLDDQMDILIVVDDAMAEQVKAVHPIKCMECGDFTNLELGL